MQDESAKLQKAEQFHQVQQAYEILSDDHRRQRYDEKVKLAELRADMSDERVPLRRAPDYDYGPPRGGSSSKYEVRGGRMYEERVPNSSRAYEEDAFSAHFTDSRPSVRKYDERYGSSSTKRTSGRVQEERKSAREFEEEYERRRREKDRAAEAAAREQKTKRRDKDRRRDSEAKSRSKNAYVEDDGSDSELDGRYYSKREEAPKRRYEDVRKREREEVPRRSSKREESYDPEYEQKVYAAMNHIKSSREVIDPEPRRATRSRTASIVDTRTPPAPPAVDVGKRSSGRGRGSRAASPLRSSGKDKRTSEKVETPSSRRPTMPVASTDPKGLKKSIFNAWSSGSKKEPHRSATYQPPTEPKHPSIRRSETTPISQMKRGDPTYSKSSKKNIVRTPSVSSESSDSDSVMTEDLHPPPPRPRLSPRHKSTRYQIHDDADNLVLEPDEYAPRPREDSPKTRRGGADRPSVPRVSSNARGPLPRAASYAYASEERPRASRTESARVPPTLKTHQSSRHSPKLYGEYNEYSPSEEYRSKGSPRMYVDVDSPKAYSRRGSEDVDRDAYPGSNFKTHRRPRNESMAAY